MLTVVAAVCAALAVVGVAAHYYPARRAWSLGVVAATPYLMLFAPVATVLFAVAGCWPAAVGAAALTIWAVGTQTRLWIGGADAAGVELVVMTANLWVGRAAPDAVITAARRHGVEVLLIEEITADLAVALDGAGLHDLLPHGATYPAEDPAAGMALWSRHPLTDLQVHGGLLIPVLSARVHVPGVVAAPTVVALHLAGPVPDASFWRRDIARLPDLLGALPVDAPLIVGGDFNATPDTVQFRRVLAAGYRGATEQAGAGHRPSWPAHGRFRPLIAIDHVLTRGATARAVRTVEIAGSDHRALVARLVLPSP
jgi:endonuclease/exonuclease/phosphatase (EEP) superfamily protein YafD